MSKLEWWEPGKREKGKRGQELFFLLPALGFLTSLNDLRRFPFGNFCAAGGPFTMTFRPTVPFTLCGIAILSEEYFDSPFADILNVVIVSCTQKSETTTRMRFQNDVVYHGEQESILLDRP